MTKSHNVWDSEESQRLRETIKELAHPEVLLKNSTPRASK